MLIHRQIKVILGLFILCMPWLSQGDVLINVTATLTDPTCNISTEDGQNRLDIGFGPLNMEQITTGAGRKDFSLYITNCNFSKRLSIVMSPQSAGTLNFSGRKILATGLDNLGIDFIDSTPGISPRYLELGTKERIVPVKIDSTKYRITLTAMLRVPTPTESIGTGKFNTSMTIFVTYD